MTYKYKTPIEEVERAAGLYKTNQDAGNALGITPGAFSRLCKKYGIETPFARRRRLHKRSSSYNNR